jgi:hypothetical protein
MCRPSPDTRRRIARRGTRKGHLPAMDAMPLHPETATTLQAEPRLSEVFAALAAEDRPRVAIGDVVEALGDRSFAPVMILLAVPNAIPFLPGSSAVLGLLLALIGLQLMFGLSRVRLPQRLTRWSFDREAFGRMVARITPWLTRFERMARPRYWPATYRLGERLAGAVSIGLALMIMLPIPFANAMPALAICLLALGISERDGVWLGAGIVAGAVAAGVVVGLFAAGFAAAATFW